MEHATTSQLLSVPVLKDRGWTDRLIRKLLGKPDECKINPFQRNAPAMKLYSMKRVLQAEGLGAFKRTQVDPKKRSYAAAKATHTKLMRMLMWAHSVPIELPNLPLNRLVQLAFIHYNDGRRDGGATPETSSKAFIERVVIHYLIHECTPYKVLNGTRGMAGTKDARRTLGERIRKAIGEMYPPLQAECRRQLDLEFNTNRIFDMA